MIRMIQQERRGFTLVEVLVVISILAIIVAIAAGAYFAIMGGQGQDAAKATVSKVDAMLLRKMKMIRDRIKDDVREKRVGSGYPELKDAGLSTEAAEAVLLYSRMKNELPMTYAEATTAFVIPLSVSAAHPLGVILQPRAEFKGMSGADALHLQSAACLYRALNTVGVESTEQQVGEISPGGYKCFTAAGKPVTFTRLAYDGDQNELNSAPYFKGYDPFFPKKLPSGSYQSLAVELGAANTVVFWNAVTPPAAVRTHWGIPATYPAPPPAGQPIKFHTACAISWGQQGQDAPDPGTFPAIYGNGNIVSYRLREEGAKGD